MSLAALVVVCGLIVGQDGGSVAAALPGSDAAQRSRATDKTQSLSQDFRIRIVPLTHPPQKNLPRHYRKRSVLSALRRRTAGEFLAEDPNLCFSLRENEDQRQLLCNDRRSKFNFNPFGLRFGKRYNGYIYRRAIKRARTNKLSPLSLFSRELEVPT